MSEVKRYWCDECSAEMQSYLVLESDYAALEAECEKNKESAANWGKWCAQAVKERDAALAECVRLRGLLREVIVFDKAARAGEAFNLGGLLKQIEAALSAKPNNGGGAE